MKAKEISSMYWFCQSVEFGGFAAASLNIKVSAPTLSRAVSQLEETLGEKLIHRHAKLFRLTAAGKEYYEKFAPLFNQINDQWDQLANLQPRLTGDIRISCPEPFADSFLQQAAIEFMGMHPDVNIHIDFSSDTDNFFDDQIDLAVSTNPPKAPHLIQRKLFNLELSLAASPAYLSQHGKPKDIEDLQNYNLLGGNTIPFWEFKRNNKSIRVPIKPKYSIDSLRLVLQAACAGLGVCQGPSKTLAPLVARGELEILLPEIECQMASVYLVWADRKLVSARVSAFREMMFEKVNQSLAFLSTITDH